MITQVTPTKIRLEGFDDKEAELRKLLTYTDKTAQFRLQRHKNAHWYINKFGEEAWREELENLKRQVHPCLLEIGKDGHFYTYSGLRGLIQETYPDEAFKNEVYYQKPDLFAWAQRPKWQLRDFQKEAVLKCKEHLHAAVNAATGSGKSFVIMQLIKELGMKSLVMVPSKSIALQMYDMFVEYLGQNRVGLFGDSKKQLGKAITIAISKSLSNVKPDTKEWEFFSHIEVLCVDECHLVGADTLQDICFNLLAKVPYRYFFSGSPTRNDGRDLVLDGIIGPIVQEITVQDGVKLGFLAKPNFIIAKAKSNSTYFNRDALKMIKAHFYDNASVHEMGARMACKALGYMNHPTLIMIDKVEQFKYLLPYLPVNTPFAHSGANTEVKKMLPPEYHKSDVKKLVKGFNDGSIRMLVGTSVIGIGTDLRPTKTIINLQAGKSETKFKQLVGRGTRLVEGKTEFNFVDFDIANIPLLSAQAEGRIEIYNEIFPSSIKYL